jgi:hypothetical protein
VRARKTSCEEEEEEEEEEEVGLGEGGVAWRTWRPTQAACLTTPACSKCMVTARVRMPAARSMYN